MDLGPVEFVVLEFPGADFMKHVGPPLTELVDGGTVRIIDLVIVKKSPDGTVSAHEFDAVDEAAAFTPIDGDAGGLLSEADVDELAAALPRGWSALVIVWEDTWAAPLQRAVLAAGGELASGARLPRLVIEAAMSELEGAGATGAEGVRMLR